jgi:hypothetical protein
MLYSSLSQFSKSLSNEDKVFLAIQSICGKQVSSLVDESNKYCFKCFDGSVNVIDRNFVNDIAGI